MKNSSESGISRRAFLSSLAAMPLAARLGAIENAASLRVVVVGAGAFGGWTAAHLLARGAKVTLIDAWGPGNSRASSGGETRVIRAVYGRDRVYVEMVKRAWELWEALEADSRAHLYIETGALWMHRGDDSYLRSSLPILVELGFPVERLPIEDVARRYPQLRLDGLESVWIEQRAGVLSARESCAVVRDAFVDAGGDYRVANATPGSTESGRMRFLTLGDGSQVEADVFVFACGPWLSSLFPGVLDGWIRPTRQEVYYFGMPGGSDRYAPPKLPVWIDFGERIRYGLPDTHGRGFKFADDTRGEPIDPSGEDRTPTADGVERARAFLAERFPEIARAPLVEARVCQYENSPDGHLLIDRHPGAGNAWLVGGGSGHGFKLGPAVGEMTAAAILSDGALPSEFNLDRSRMPDTPSTQFEEK